MKLKALLSTSLAALITLSILPCAFGAGEDVKVYSELKDEYSAYSLEVFIPNDEKISEILGASLDQIITRDIFDSNNELSTTIYSIKGKELYVSKDSASIWYTNESQDKYASLIDTFDVFNMTLDSSRSDFDNYLKKFHPDEYEKYLELMFEDPETQAALSEDVGEYTAEQAYNDALEFIAGLYPDYYTPYLSRMFSFSTDRVNEMLSNPDDSSDYAQFTGSGKRKKFDESVGGSYVMFFNFTLPQGYLYGSFMPKVKTRIGGMNLYGNENIYASLIAADGKIIECWVNDVYELNATETAAPVVDAETALAYYYAVFGTDEYEVVYLKPVTMMMRTAQNGGYRNYVLKPYWMIALRLTHSDYPSDLSTAFINILKPEFINQGWN